MKPTKNFLFISFILGALLIAGLFFIVLQSQRSATSPITQPSQLNFTQSNQLPARTQPQPASADEKKQSSLQSSVEDLPKVQILQGEDKSKWSVIDNLLRTKNDNDPRIDSDLKKLSPLVHEALYEKYDSLVAEDRSGRGLITFLIARDLNSIDDMQFLKKVYQEAPCLSLEDCKVASADDPHHSSVNQTTLIYPQLSPLFMIEKQLTERPELLNNAAFRSGIIQILAQAESFAVPAVQEKAKAIRLKFGL